MRAKPSRLVVEYNRPSILRLKAEPITEVRLPSRGTPSPAGKLWMSTLATVLSPQPFNVSQTISAPDVGAETVLVTVPGNDYGASESRQTPNLPMPENEARPEVTTCAGVELLPINEVI